VIQSFRCRETERIFRGGSSPSFPPDIQDRARERLRRLHAATSLNDLAALRSNRLEPLRGDRQGQHSIRINDQWRICFLWEGGHAYNVEIVDYH
jgi:toxin HigB-1